jgi:hypothetical protein
VTRAGRVLVGAHMTQCREPYQYRRRLISGAKREVETVGRSHGQSRGQSRPDRLLDTSASRSLSHSCEGQSRSSQACRTHSRGPMP